MDDIRNRLISVFETHGYFFPVNLDDEDVNITEYDISSLDFISIIIGIEDEFDFNVPDEKLSLDLFNSFNGLLEFVTTMVSNRRDGD